jgi:hypothetical protein
MTYIIDKLYLGDVDDAYDTEHLRDKLGVTHILSITQYVQFGVTNLFFSICVQFLVRPLLPPLLLGYNSDVTSKGFPL